MHKEPRRRSATGLAFIVVAALASGATNSAAQERLVFPEAEYSIQPLEPEHAEGGYQSLMMFLPADGGFAPNVNVQIQAYGGSAKGYVDLSAEQMKGQGFTLLKSAADGDDAATFEYTGKANGRDLHWFARVVVRGGRAYLATATATAQQWEEVSDQLVECVSSLRLE